MSNFDSNGMLLPDEGSDVGFGLETTNTAATFVSGAVRSDSTGRGHYEDVSPLAYDRIAKHLEKGAGPHGTWNYMLGMGMKRGMQSVLRHGYKYLYHKLTGKPQLEDHLAAMAFGVISLMHTEEMIKEGLAPKELDDIPTLESLKAAAENRKKGK